MSVLIYVAYKMDMGKPIFIVADFDKSYLYSKIVGKIGCLDGEFEIESVLCGTFNVDEMAEITRDVIRKCTW